jgi:lipopolysaccharide export system permease protein
MAPFTRIYFRYLFLRLFVPFAVCLAACTLIWIMADLYGNIDDFLENKISFFPLMLKILRFYGLQIPIMLVQVLPAAILFSTLWTLLALNRRCELVAFQSGGMAPIWLFSPFFAFACIWMAILAYDLNWPAAKAAITKDRILLQVKGQNAKSNVYLNLPYVDNVNNRIWFFQSLDTNQGTAKGIEILLRDDQGDDLVKYFAEKAEWVPGGYWRLTNVLEITFGPGGTVKTQKTYSLKDLDISTPPQQLSLIVSQPEQLSLSQLSDYIANSTSSPENLAKYRTEWWYRVLYPFSLIVLMLFALLQGTRTDRRGAAGGVIWIIVVLLLYIVFTNIFIVAGRTNHLPPFVAVIATEAIFGAIGLYLLALSNGWWWQLLEAAKRWQAFWAEEQDKTE